MTSWYSLPVYYDVSFSHDMREELAFLKKIFQLYSDNRNPKLLEPACGTGRLLVPLLRDGYRCTGFDNNPQALAYLKKN